MKKFFVIVFLVILAAPFFAQAAPCVKTPGQNVKPGDLPACINQIYVWSLGAGALLGLLMMVVGGYYYMTSGGNAERATTGVEMIWSSIIGIALLFGAYLLLNTINPDLVKFNYFANDFQNLNTAATSSGPRGPFNPGQGGQSNPNGGGGASF